MGLLLGLVLQAVGLGIGIVLSLLVLPFDILREGWLTCWKNMHHKQLGPIYFTLLPFEVVSEGWRAVFNRTYRRKPPPILHDPRWGEHKFADLDGLRIHYVEKGDNSRPLMIFVHGFPEFWFSWRHQLEHFSKEYWCVAMDNRGYGESDKPKSQKDYSIDKLADDVANLSKHLGRDSFILVGHDWGGAIGYEVCRRHANMVKAYVVCNCPHNNALTEQIRMGWDQRIRSWYMLFFQAPLIPELFFRKVDFAFIENFHNTMAPERRPSGAEIECYKYTFGKTPDACTYPLNYYRQALQSGRKMLAKNTVPTLQLWGLADLYLTPRVGRESRKFNEDFEEKFFPGVSHNIHMERPELVNQSMDSYLRRRKIAPSTAAAAEVK